MLIAASVLVPPAAQAAPNVAGMIVFLDPGHQAAMDGMSRQVPTGRGGTKDCQASGTSTDDGFPEHTFTWDTVLRIRQELSKAIETGGGTVEEVDGPLGKQLNVRMPQQGPDGRTVFAPARFVGVDGPRWFLRAVLSGQAAVDDEAAEQLIAGLRQFVVHRGQSPMAPREMLPLTLPPAAPVVEEQAEPEPGDSDADGTDERYTRPDLNPFERGPEITEVR